jgi:hypothetical protein
MLRSTRGFTGTVLCYRRGARRDDDKAGETMRLRIHGIGMNKIAR